MGKRLRCRIIVFAVVAIAAACLVEARKSTDPYKVLGVDRNASQRDIQKAFHKLSLQYHPDKNKSKGAQAKFEEINNAYEILSDDEKRKNYDLYGDENSGPSFGAGNAGDFGGYQHFTSGGAGHDRFASGPDGWQGMGGQGKSQSFSFSFGDPSSGNSFGFGLNDFFSNFFGGDSSGGSKFDSFGGSWGSQFGGSQSSAGFRKSSAKNVKMFDSRVFEKEVYDNGLAWLLVSYRPSIPLNQQEELVLEEIASSLKGALKVGKVNCDSSQSFCMKYGIYPRGAPKALVYSFTEKGNGHFVEFEGEWNFKGLKSFCQDNLPRVSKRVNLDKFDGSVGAGGTLPRVMLLSTKKDAPTIWRALSGLYRKRFMFYHTQVHDVTDPAVNKLGVDALPALVGWLSNGEKHVIKAGITVKSLDSAVQELSLLLDGFEKKNRKTSSSQAKNKQEADKSSAEIPLLTASNFNAVCGDTTPVCIIGAYRSSNARKKLESILLTVSKKTMSRSRFPTSESKNPVSYAMFDAVKQQEFLDALGESGLKSVDELLLAYKPRKGKYAVLKDWDTMEEAESFISSVLSGDVQLKKTRRKPKLV
ncbi:DnaJ protein ERDJ3A-like protein [Drosera capensis]